MPQPYILEWFDLLVTITLNPLRADVLSITISQSEVILKKAGEEKDKWQLQLKREVYECRSNAEIELLVRRYHSDLILLLDQAYENHNLISAADDSHKILTRTIAGYLEELVTFIEGRYLKFLGLDKWIPASYLHLTREELRSRIERLRLKIGRRLSDKKLLDIVFGSLYKFINEEQFRRVTFREVVYKKELVSDLEEICAHKTEAKLHQALMELLVYRNFNKKAYLNYYTEKIAGRINSLVSLTEKRDQLLLAYKEFNQMHLKPGVKLNPNFKGIKSVIGNWFAQEINYLEMKYQWDVNPLEPRRPVKAGIVSQKVRLSLNSDQIAILLRALVDIGLIERGSVHWVFKTIVPFLASAEKENLSWDSVRKRAYAPEDKDKHVVIQVLANAIKTIKNIDRL